MINVHPLVTRSRLLRRAIITSLFGKFVSVVTQLVAIPLAIGALGLERFGVYAMLTAIFLWTNTASSAVASALTLQLVPAAAAGDRTRESELFSTAFFFALSAAFILCVGFQIALSATNIGQIFGLQSRAYDADLYSAAWCMALLLPVNLLLSPAEAAHTGFQRQDVNNVLLTVANVFTIIGLLFVVQWFPSIQNMVLAMFLPVTISKVFNFALLLSRRPYLLPRFRYASGATLRGLLTTGAAFALTQVGTFIYLQFPIFYVGREVGPDTAAYLATMMLVISISGSALIMFTQPLLPALRDSMAKHDQAWARQAASLLLRRLVPYITLAAVAIGFFGSQFITILTRQPANIEIEIRWFWAAFFWIVAWEHVGYTFAVGVGKLWQAARLYVYGSMIALTGCLLLVPIFGMAGAFASMCLGPIIFTVLQFPRLIHIALQPERVSK